MCTGPMLEPAGQLLATLRSAWLNCASEQPLRSLLAPALGLSDIPAGSTTLADANGDSAPGPSAWSIVVVKVLATPGCGVPAEKDSCGSNVSAEQLVGSTVIEPVALAVAPFLPVKAALPLI